jgi:hypothetical protein
MVKWDIKDGFWCMDCAEGEEWNIAYMLPQAEGKPTKLVDPTSLHMGWVESPSYFCAATKTTQNRAMDYTKNPIHLLSPHKFVKYTIGGPEYEALPESQKGNNGYVYTLEVYVDNFMSLIIPASREQIRHVTTAVMTGIHDVFQPDDSNNGNPISAKNLKKGEGTYSTRKTLLGFDFNRDEKTMWLKEAKHKKLLTILKGWIRAGKRGTTGIPFTEFESTIAKIRHAFTCIPAGVGLLSPCNQLLQKCPSYVYLIKNNNILTAMEGCQTLLRKKTLEPTKCRELICGWPDYVGIIDASGHGIGGVIFGETSACIPTVFRWEWPKDIKNNIKTLQNPNGKILNSDLEMAGLLMLWLVIEGVSKDLCKKHVTLFGGNLPTRGWVMRLASKRSIIAKNLIQALALQLKTQHACPLTPMHIEGKQNAISGVSS